MQLKRPAVCVCHSSKWKADRGAVTSLCVSPDGKLLLSAGLVIKMWDLDTKEVYRVSARPMLFIWSFLGPESVVLGCRTHTLGAGIGANENIRSQFQTQDVFSPINCRFVLVSFPQKFTGHSTAVTTLRFATTRPPDSNGLYFLSGAAHDRLLSVW